MELLKLNLAIEPDLQGFIQFALTAVSGLGGNPFASALAALEASRGLRDAGAGTGYPLPAAIELHGKDVCISWNGGGWVLLSRLRALPAPGAVEALRRHLQQSTEVTDPAVLHRRNAEMMRYLDETRARTERELASLQAALEARQAELHATLKQAETDPLTGLLNRRAFDARIGAAFRRTMRQRTEPLSLIFLDLDHFKEINDRHGHQYGDAYLNKMAQAMLGVIREDVDAVFRFGGDEFAILIFAEAQTACLKARQVLAEMGGKVSIGITSITPETPGNLTLEAFMHRADDALYQAKRAGRGRVVMEVCAPAFPEGCSDDCPAQAPSP